MVEEQERTSLRSNLQNTLNHIDNLESNRAFSNNYEKEFQDLKQFSDSLKGSREYSTKEGEKEVNRKKNRYKDILPFDISRVILSEYAGLAGSDYINANFIKGASGSPAYIASQGPLSHTVNDFWRMVVECEVQVIVMACNPEEAGKRKCENYWVEKEGEEKKFGMVEICLVKASTVCPDFLVRTMRLKYLNDKSITEERTVCQFHYSTWPDHGVPPLVRPLLDMVKLVRDTQASETLPVLVHCSAGCGRTGTICAIDFVFGLLRAGKLTKRFSLFNLVRDMRKQRIAMVQTKEQYILVHQAVRELFKQQLKLIESHPYENVDLNGILRVESFKDDPVYDTIKDYTKDISGQETTKSVQRREEECSRAPPLPVKMSSKSIISSSHKEITNINDKLKNTSIDLSKDDICPSNASSSKPRIAKLKALFERQSSKPRSSGVTRSLSLGAVKKPVLSSLSHTDTQPQKSSKISGPLIRGEENCKVPKSGMVSMTANSNQQRLIKRSKSLKIIRSDLSCVPLVNLPVEQDCVDGFSPMLINSSTLSTIAKNNSGEINSVRLETSIAPDWSRRRRSLESLIGDETSLWLQENKHMDNVLHTSQQAASPKSHLQNMSSESQNKMTSLVSGLAVKERRNSFRQAMKREQFAPRSTRLNSSIELNSAVRSPDVEWQYISQHVEQNNVSAFERNAVHVDQYLMNSSRDNLVVKSQDGQILKPSSVSSLTPNARPNLFFRQSHQKNCSSIEKSGSPNEPGTKNRFLRRLTHQIQGDKFKAEVNQAKSVKLAQDNVFPANAYQREQQNTPKLVQHQSDDYENLNDLPSAKNCIYHNLQPQQDSTSRNYKNNIKNYNTSSSQKPDMKLYTFKDTVSEPITAQRSLFKTNNYDLISANNKKKLSQNIRNIFSRTCVHGNFASTEMLIHKSLDLASGSDSPTSHSSGDLSENTDSYSPVTEDVKETSGYFVNRTEQLLKINAAKLDSYREYFRDQNGGDVYYFPSIMTRQEHGVFNDSESSSSSGTRELQNIMKPAPLEDDHYKFGLVARVQVKDSLDRNVKSQDDLALVNHPNAPPRIKRRASIMVSRHVDDTPSQELEPRGDKWNIAPGVDLDAVAASISLSRGGTPQRNLKAPDTRLKVTPVIQKKQQYL